MEARLRELNENEILLYLGHRGQELTPELEALLRDCQRELLTAARPRVHWIRTELEETRLPDGLLTLQGEDIAKHLRGCGECILMAATLGGEVDGLLRRTQLTDMSRAVVLDACGSAAIESLCDHLEAELREALEREGLYLTDRYSPGYGDFPIEQQRELCRVLDTGRRLGLSLTKTGLMTPMKSVTAVLGISPVPVERRSRGCESCNLFRTCEFRKEGISCGT